MHFPGNPVLSGAVCPVLEGGDGTHAQLASLRGRSDILEILTRSSFPRTLRGEGARQWLYREYTLWDRCSRFGLAVLVNTVCGIPDWPCAARRFISGDITFYAGTFSM